MDPRRQGMSRFLKCLLVLAGYVLAFVTSFVAVAIYDRKFTPEENQTMGGMIAGGEMLYGLAVLALASLVPTGMALWFLRRHRPSWSAFSSFCLGYSAAGLAIVGAMLIAPYMMLRAPVLEFFGLLQMLGSPILVGGFGLFALLAPA